MFFHLLEQECNNQGIAVSAFLEANGFSKGNMSKWKAGREPKAATKILLAEKLHLDKHFFMQAQTASGNPGEQLSIDDQVNNLLSSLLYSETLMLDGKPATPEAAEFLRNSIAANIEYAKKLNDTC